MLGRRFTSSRIRKERQRRLLIQAILWIVLLGALLFLAVEIVYAKQLRIEHVRFEGNTAVHKEALWDVLQPYVEGEYAHLFSKKNIFIVPTDTIEQELETHFVRLKNVELSREGFHTLVVTSVEREPAGIWCPPAKALAQAGDVGTSTECFYIDEAALAFAPAPHLRGTTFITYEHAFPETVIGTQLTTPEQFTALHDYMDALMPLGFATQRVTWRDDGIDLYVRGKVTDDIHTGLILKIPLVPPYDIALSNLASVTRSAKEGTPALVIAGIEYIDLRFENKVFFKRNGVLVDANGATTSAE